MPKFLSDIHASGTSTDLAVDGNITGTGNLTLTHANTPKLQVIDTTNDVDFTIQSANTYVQMHADSDNDAVSTRIQMKIDGGLVHEFQPTAQLSHTNVTLRREDTHPSFTFQSRRDSGNFTSGTDLARIAFQARDSVVTSDTMLANLIVEADNTFAANDKKTRMKMQVFTGTAIENVLLLDSDKSATFYGQVKAPSFYDSDNTAYFIDPSSTSTSLNVAGDITAINGDSHSFLTGNTSNLSTADTTGFRLHQTSYTDGKYTHRFRKKDMGGGVPLYLDFSSGTANVFANLMRFGKYTGESIDVEVNGKLKATHFYGDGSNLTNISSTDNTKLPLAGGTMTGAINMGNFNITGVNAISFNDPGPSEGVTWTNTKIFESPDDLTTNTAGNLQITYSNTRRLTVNSTGIDVNGHIQLKQYGYLDFGSNPSGSSSYNQLQLFNSLSGATLKQGGAGDLELYSVSNNIVFRAAVAGLGSQYGLKVVGESIRTPILYETGDTSVYLDLGNTTTSLKTAGPIITKGVNQFKSVGGTGSSVVIELKANSSASNSDYLAKSTIKTMYDTTTPSGGTANNNSIMQFRVGKGTDANQHTALTLDSSLDATFAGNVVIGTVDTVTTGLSIGEASPTIQLFDTTNNAKLLMYTQDSSSIIGTYSNHPLAFYTDSGLTLTLNTDHSATFAGSITMPTAGSQIKIGSFTSGSSNSGEYADDDLVIGDGSISIYPHRRGDYGLDATTATSTTFRSKLNIWSDNEDHITFGGASTHMVSAWESWKMWINNDSTSAGTLHLYNKTSKTEFARLSGSGSSFVLGTFDATSDLRAPIFYDRADTTYYIDPASTSNLNNLNASVLEIDGKKVLDMPSNSTQRGPWNPIASFVRGSGTAVYGDEDFVSGSNSINVYNNQGGTGVQHVRETDGTTLNQVAPNSSGYVIRVVNNGNNTSPGRGGFYQTISAVNNQTFVQVFQAKLESGKTFEIAENAQGDNKTSYFLTDNAGTGKFEWYVRVSHCGDSGSFSSGGHIYVNGGSANEVFTWYLASSEIYKVTDAQNRRIKSYIATASMVSPVYYDTNTSYYLDADGFSKLESLRVDTVEATDIDALQLHNRSNGAGVQIKFCDQNATFNDSNSQHGTITFRHSDSQSYGSGASLTLTSDQSTTTILADGKLMYGEGIYSKPSSGTGAGTRKDSNWDTAYGWGNHASGGYSGFNFGATDLTFQGADPGDIVWKDADGTEVHRIWSGSNDYLTYRNDAGTTYELISAGSTSYNNSNWDTAYGWGNHASAGYLTSSHTHDDRYYTETEIKDFAKRGYIESQSAGNLAVGWYTIAQNTGNRAFGEFQIWDTASSRHQSVIFNAAHHYGTDDSNSITVLGNSSYSTDVFKYIRIKENGTYDGAAIQVYIDDATNGVNVAIIGGNAQSAGWALVDWLADSSSPSEISNWTGATEKTRIDLDNIHSGGIATTGEIYAGGATTQYKAFHAGNFTDNSSNWNTAYGWGNHATAGYISSFDITTQTDAKYLRSNAADTATHRVIFSGCDTNNHDTIATGTGSLGSIEIFNNGSGKDAFMTFHVGGDYACYFGLDGGTNKLSVGGWSMGAASYEIYHSGNKPSLSTLGFTGATNANYITNNNQLTNGAGYVTASNTVDKANGLAEVGYGTDEGTFQQLSSSFAGFTGGWANYFIGNHGNGSNYYNTVHIMPFWGPPKYSRLENNSLKGPFNYLTDEIDTVTSKYLQSNSSLRAPIFYDSNDTSYYIDPNGTSKLSTIKNVKIENIGKSPIGTGYGSGKLLGYNGINSSGRAAATLGVNEQGYVMEYEKIMTFKIEGNGWVNRSSNPYKLIQAPGTDKMIVVDEFLVYIDYATRTGLGSNGIGLSYEQAAYSVGFYLNETGQSISTANHGVSSTFYTAGIMPGGFMNNSLDRGYYRDVPVHQSALIANRSLFFKTSRNCSSSSNAPGGAHYIKIKYRVIDISEEFNAAGCNQTINVSGYHGQYAHNADGQKQYGDDGNPVF